MDALKKETRFNCRVRNNNVTSALSYDSDVNSYFYLPGNIENSFADMTKYRMRFHYG